MAEDGVQVRAVSRNGACMLWIIGELDTMVADSLARRARAAVDAVPGPVVVDLSGLRFVDAHGARTLDELIRHLPGDRAAAVRCCPLRVRRVLNRLGLALDGCPAAAEIVPPPGDRSLADLVRNARLDAARSRLYASASLNRLADTRIRLANTIERSGLLREQVRKTVASCQAARRPGPRRQEVQA